MTSVPTWTERCNQHPDHQSGMVSHGMIQARMQEEIDDLRAEIERLRDEDTKTRHALRGWVWVCPDGGDEPTHERVSAVVAEVERLRAEVERLRDVLRRVVVYPSGDRAARVAFVSVGCQVSFPLHPQTTWALELLVEFDQARRKALEAKS